MSIVWRELSAEAGSEAEKSNIVRLEGEVSGSEVGEERVVHIRVREVYGTIKYYPENETAQIFADINQCKTLSTRTLDNIKKLGYRVRASYAVPM